MLNDAPGTEGPMLAKCRRGAVAFEPAACRGLAHWGLLFGSLVACSLVANSLVACSQGDGPGSTGVQQQSLPASQAGQAWSEFVGRSPWLGGTLSARLRPLLVSPAQRGFDEKAWRLGPGQILWSLQLQWALGEGSAGGEGPLASEWSLADLAVEHDDGAPLRFREIREVRAGSGVYDPLQVLLSAPPGPLTPGPGRSLVFVGPGNLKLPKLVGLPVELLLGPDPASTVETPTSETRTAERPPSIPILDYSVPNAQ